MMLVNIWLALASAAVGVNSQFHHPVPVQQMQMPPQQVVQGIHGGGSPLHRQGGHRQVRRKPHKPGMSKVTDKVFFEVAIKGKRIGRIEIAVFGKKVPFTAKNFVEIAKGYYENDGTLLHYKRSKFHRVVNDFMIQGGDITHHDGTGGKSIYGHVFKDENFKLKHYGSGTVAMANSGRDMNSSQFYITLRATPWLDHRHVVFGKVISGMKVVKQISEVPTNAKNQPLQSIEIVDSGIVPTEHFWMEKHMDSIH